MGQSAEYQGPEAFLDFAAEAADGVFRADVSREFVGLVKACHEQAVAQGATAKGKLTLELNFTIDARGEVDFTYATKRKDPPKPTARGRLWMGKNGMTAVHPKQLEITGTERKRRAEAPPAPGRREEANPEAADDGDDS